MLLLERWSRKIYGYCKSSRIFSKNGFQSWVLDADIYGPSMPIMFDVENEKYRLPLTENQNETSRKLRDKNSFYWILHITISSCDLEDQWLQKR
jgi:hypothetical protein